VAGFGLGRLIWADAQGGRAILARSLAALLACCLWCSAAAAAPRDAPVPIRLAAGSTSKEVTGGIARGELACFTIEARRGQHMAISQPDPGDSNIVMQIYRPPWAITREDDGISVRGHPLPGAKEGDDAKGWVGTLPATGRYLLVLGTSWGGGSYRVLVKLD
jgi:hypothetical protein